MADTNEILLKFWDTITHGVDWIAYVIVTIGGLIGKYRLSGWRRFFKWKIDNAFKTLAISTAALTVYALIQMWSGTFVKADAPRIFFGYIVATGLYPLTVKLIEKWVKKIFGYSLDDKPDTDNPN